MHVYVVLNYCCCRCYACAGVGVSTIENVDGVVVIDDDVDTHVAAADGIHVVAVDAADVDGVVVDVTNVVLTAVVVVVSFARDYNVAAMDNDVTGANVANAIDVDVIDVGDLFAHVVVVAGCVEVINVVVVDDVVEGDVLSDVAFVCICSNAFVCC